MVPLTAPKSVERGIINLIEDGIGFAIYAERPKSVDSAQPLSRASLLATFLLLEAVANACLENISVKGKFGDNLDRLPVLSKFDLYLTVRLKKRQLDRGKPEVQAIQELKGLRDSFVHQRKQHIIWEKWSPRGESISRSPVTPILGLSKIPAYSHFGDAVTALRVTHEFFSYFFGKRCGFSQRKVSSLLVSEDPCQRNCGIITPVLDKRIQKWLQQKNIKLDYLKVIWSDYGDIPVWGIPTHISETNF